MKTLITWAIYASIGVAAACGSSAVLAVDASPTVAGDWKEYWGNSGQTVLTYNDHYRVNIAANGHGSIEILGRNQTIDAFEIKENGITFTQHTALAVKYALSLQPDDNWMIGTATTPTEVVNIRWERIKISG